MFGSKRDRGLEWFASRPKWRETISSKSCVLGHCDCYDRLTTKIIFAICSNDQLTVLSFGRPKTEQLYFFHIRYGTDVLYTCTATCHVPSNIWCMQWCDKIIDCMRISIHYKTLDTYNFVHTMFCDEQNIRYGQSSIIGNSGFNLKGLTTQHSGIAPARWSGV